MAVELPNQILITELNLVRHRAGAARDRINLKRQTLQDIVHRIPLPSLSVSLVELLETSGGEERSPYRVELESLVDSMASSG